MLLNYIKVALRNLWRHKAYSFINIFGLSIGLATCLLLLLYIFDEISIDKHHQDGDRVYRVYSSSGKGGTWAAGPGPLAAGLKANLPEVEASTRILTFPDIETMLMKHEEAGRQKQFFESNGYYVDSTFFDLFTYRMIYGNAKSALQSPNTIVISNTLARKFFSNVNPVGKALKLTTPFGEFDYTVNAVFDDATNKSHLGANFFLSMRNTDMWNWVINQTRWTTNNIFFTYIKLKKGVDAKVFERKLKPVIERYAGEDMRLAGFSKTFLLQPLEDIYLHSALGNEIASNGNINYLYILGSIAGFILIIACINFMNLSTARSGKRAREVGVRKVLGARKSVLIQQFLGESLIMCLLALVFALLLANLLLPVFNTITAKKLQIFGQPEMLATITALTLMTGFLSGVYPAFYLSAFQPVAVLKGKIRNSFSATTIRKGLVVFQFTISVCLIFGAIVIWQQLGLLKNQQLGFKKDYQLVLPLQQSYKNSEGDYTRIKNEILLSPGVKSVTAGSTYPGIPNLNDILMYAEGKNPEDFVDMRLCGIDDGYLETLGMQLVSGRAFSSDFKADSASIIVNETAIRELGYEPNTAVGKKIQYDFAGKHATMEIVGIVKNFNFESLHNVIKPLGFTTGSFTNRFAYTIVSLQNKDVQKQITALETIWNKLYPAIPFVYSFIDRDFERNYEKEQRSSAIIIYFTAIAILIACLGLFGLAAFAAEQRTKEIGVRKVLGASISSVAGLLSGDFVKLVILAILIALPLGWFFMNSWLQDFAYRISISWWMFGAAAVIAIFIAVFTVTFHAIRAAIANPVKSLRSE